MQRIVLAEPSVLHLSKLMEGNRKQRETEESQSVLHATHTPSTYPGFIWDSTRTSGCGGKLFKGHVQSVQTNISYRYGGKHAGTLYTCWKANCIIVQSLHIENCKCFNVLEWMFYPYSCVQTNKYNMHLEADQKQYIFQRHLGVNVASTSCHTTQIHA